MANLRGVSHRDLGTGLVSISPAVALAGNKAGLDKVGEDPLGRAFGDTYPLRHVAYPHVGITVETQQDLCMAREELPRLL